MTIQEKAIEQLERVSKHLATIGEKEDYIGVAIQALEQECEDAISRKAVLDIVRFEENWLSDAKSNNADTDIAFSGIRTQIAKLSPVTKALEPCKDAVSRQAVLNTLSRMDSVLDEDRTVETYKELLVACFNDLPPATPAHKTGRWIRKPIRNNKGGCVGAKMICTCCGKDNECGRKLNYCPNCGAKIESEEK